MIYYLRSIAFGVLAISVAWLAPGAHARRP